ncbi:mycofactocin biosynthesis chaperone MftB [Amycolatopsis panacis]|uniref:Mycofactocin biosynthesis chaperone MftB n=1 Tax=Amycolatopsis panacis TaxID=2340917 RepID=A0A419I623_9PSEU|nr:mycofactocin biosynthesis chaperone MftB [Amycolatopsis panacis]RJQ86620.1 mycofactocin biosynthesis chaperone MftB [Amycolatopsis panacis]
MSTETAAAVRPFDLDAAWCLDERVAVRPERFGALLYHFGTRRLSFLKSPGLLTVVRSLAEHPSARAACAGAGITAPELPRYRGALAALAASRMIRPRSA